MPQNFLYRFARTKFLMGQLSWQTASAFKVMPLCMTGSSGLGGSNTNAGYGTVTSYETLGNSLTGGSGNFAGGATTSLGAIPRMHRTYYRAAYGGTLTESDSTSNHFNSTLGGIAHSQGGTANTYVLVTNATTHTYIGQATIGSGVTYGDGVAAGSDLTFYAVGSGTTIGSFVIYKHDSNVDTENMLVAFFDIATSMPVNTNGGDITIVWDTTANRIFKL